MDVIPEPFDMRGEVVEHVAGCVRLTRAVPVVGICAEMFLPAFDVGRVRHGVVGGPILQEVRAVRSNA